MIKFALSHFNMLYKLELLILFSFWASASEAKPIEKSSEASVSKRLNSELQELIEMSMQQADMHVLKGLPEEKLNLLENLLRSWAEEERVEQPLEDQPQSDQPLEDQPQGDQPQGDEPIEDAAYLSDAPESGDLTRMELEENSTLSSSYYYDANSTKTYRDMWVDFLSFINLFVYIYHLYV